MEWRLLAQLEQIKSKPTIMWNEELANQQQYDSKIPQTQP